MEESILASLTKLLVGDHEDEWFNPDLIMHINTALNRLYSLGVGRKRKHPFAIKGLDETWSEFLGDEYDDLQNVQTYVFLKVKIVFDPPTANAVLQSMNENIRELESMIEMECNEIDMKRNKEYTES